jgi:predicted transcriptional regulator
LRQSRTPVEIAYEILRYIKENDASKWDLVKIVGNNRQFDHWVTGFLIEDGFVIVPDNDSEYYRLSDNGDILFSLLKKGNLMNSLFKLSGSRLRT